MCFVPYILMTLHRKRFEEKLQRKFAMRVNLRRYVPDG